MRERLLIANPPWCDDNRVGVRAGSRWPFTMPVRQGQREMAYAPFPFFMAYAALLHKFSTTC